MENIMKNIIINNIKNTMKQTSLIFALSLCSLLVAQEADMQDAKELQESNTKEVTIKQDSMMEEMERENEYILIPSLGYSSLGVTTGLDFMYRKSNGFALLTNLNFAVPTVNLGGAIFTSELYFGYALRKNSFYVSFLSGLWVGGGTHFVAWEEHPARDKFMNGRLLVLPSLMMTFALRNDFMYFFNDKLGLHVCHTHGFGFYTHAVAMDRRNYSKDLTRYYSFMVKLGLAIRV